MTKYWLARVKSGVHVILIGKLKTLFAGGRLANDGKQRQLRANPGA
jgi:hypothetical protein